MVDTGLPHMKHILLYDVIMQSIFHATKAQKHQYPPNLGFSVIWSFGVLVANI